MSDQLAGHEKSIEALQTSAGRVTYLNGTICFGNVEGENYLVFTDIRNKKVLIELMSDELERLEELYDN